MPKKSAVLWTGGKDSCLAFYEAKKAGHEIDSLITFAPSNPLFLAHPIGFMQRQAETLNLPHRIIEIKEPYAENYKEAYHLLRKKYDITTLISGDIDEIDGHANWTREYSKAANIEIQTPLWKMDRMEILGRLLDYGFQVIFSCVKKPFFTDKWVGKEFTEDTLHQLNKINALKGIDICGEQGEYHTLVLDTPFFGKSIHIESSSIQQKNDMLYLDIHKISLREKFSAN